MSIHIDPNLLNRHMNSEHVLPTIKHTPDELKAIREAPTEIITEGDIFTYAGVNFQELSKNQLIEEKIDKSSLNLSQISHSSGTGDDRLIVAFRDPLDKEKVIAYKLDQETVQGLQEKFSSDNFFQRKDGILRLNKQAEAYVAGWVQDIKINRGYDEADLNGNGIIEKNEQGELKIGFDHNSDYDYLDMKIVTAHNSVGTRTYQKYSDTTNANNPVNILNTQALKVKDTIEKALEQSINFDKDKDGIITLKEGLEDFAHNGNSIEEEILQKTQESHKAWVEKEKDEGRNVLDSTTVLVRDIPIAQIQNDQDRREIKEAMAKYIQENKAELEATSRKLDFYSFNTLTDKKDISFLVQQA